MKKKFLVLSVILLVCSLCGCGKNTGPLTKTGFYFDTVISVTVYDSSKEYTLDKCMELAAHYENLFSPTVEGSDIWNINHSNKEPVTVNTETAFLIEKALSYATLTDGQLNPAIAPLSLLWNFSSEAADSYSVPDSQLIHERLAHTDYKKITLEGQTVYLLDEQASIDLGCIAKGYIADKLKEYLLEEQVESALINLGGNVLAVGNKPDNSSFVIGIQKPFAQSGTAETTVSISDCSAVTSGIYERYFEQDGVLYHHILDPKTGYPVDNDLASVTIISEASVDGDALSTSCLLLGLDDGMTLIESLPDTEALFITKDGELYYTTGFPK